jgi:DNA-binding NarL/FixJ family response regulator
LDVNLPGMNGVAAQQQLRQANDLCPVIFVSAELNAHHVNMAWRDGAAEFLFKPFQPKDLLNALQRVIEKQSTTPPLHRDESNQGMANTLARKHAQLIESLTPRQLQVLLWLVEGHSNTQIAEKLHISARTVKMHREGLMQRLEIRHITELARIYENCQHLLKIPPNLV